MIPVTCFGVEYPSLRAFANTFNLNKHLVYTLYHSGWKMEPIYAKAILIDSPFTIADYYYENIDLCLKEYGIADTEEEEFFQILEEKANGNILKALNMFLKKDGIRATRARPVLYKGITYPTLKRFARRKEYPYESLLKAEKNVAMTERGVVDGEAIIREYFKIHQRSKYTMTPEELEYERAKLKRPLLENYLDKDPDGDITSLFR